MSFVHLHIHSQYSLLHSAVRFGAVIDRVKKMGMPALAITDQGNLYGVVDFYQKCKSKGVQPIFGLDAYLTEGDRRDRSHQHPTQHITLLAENLQGLRNLFSLVTLGNFEGFYYKPRIDRELLCQYHEGLIGLSSGLGGVPGKHILNGNIDAAESALKEYSEIFGPENYFVELMDHGLEDEKRVNRQLRDLAEKLSLSLVATNICNYLNRDDAEAHDTLLCIGQGKTVDDERRMKFRTDEYYLKSPEEMKEIFKDCPEAIENTLRIADRCNVDLQWGDYHMPRIDLPENLSPMEFLESESRKGLDARLPQLEAFYDRRGKKFEEIESVYRQRLEHELETIRATGFAGYFLIVADFINYAKGADIPVGPGRGSAAGSLVAYSLRITDVDPIPYNLLFERFLNPERISMPDIDVDFCQEGRDSVIRYVAEKYNENATVSGTRVAQITTFGKMQAKAVIRDVGRALNMPYGDVDKIAKLVPNVLNIKLEEAFEQEAKFDEIRKNDAKIDQLLSQAVKLEGLTRHASVHAAGVVISDEMPLVHHLPLYKGQHEEVVTQWDMKGVEKVGLIKFDFLGLKTLTLMARACQLIEENQGKKINLLELDPDDPPVYELLSRGDTKGIFQLESSGMRELVVKLKPSHFEDIVALVALYRPGPLGSGMVDDFINRKHGRTPIHYDLPELEPILKETYGVILYQEQVMRIAAVLANYSLGEADLLRRAMGKKIIEEMGKQEKRFLDGAKKNNFPQTKSKKIFDLMAKFAGYGFNKSHSAAYALISFQTAYLKAHYPVEFMAASMSIDKGNTDRVVILMNDCRDQGIPVLPPDLNESHLDFSVSEGKIRFGLAAVKNVGEGAIEAILQSREEGGPFSDLFEFCRRVDSRRVNRRVIEALIKCGALDSTGVKRSLMMANLSKSVESAQQTQRDRKVGQGSLFAGEALNLAGEKAYDEAPDWDESERLQYEKESVGFYVTGHPLLKYSDQVKRYSNSDTAELLHLRDKSMARLGGMVTSLKEITTRKGDRMAFATLEDLSGSVELVVFSSVYVEKAHILKATEPIFVTGKVDIGEDQAKIIVEDISFLSDASDVFRGKVHISLDASQMEGKSLQKLKKLLMDHKGECKTLLHLRIPGKSETVLSLSDDYSVQPSDPLIREIRSLAGDTSEIYLN